MPAAPYRKCGRRQRRPGTLGQAPGPPPLASSGAVEAWSSALLRPGERLRGLIGDLHRGLGDLAAVLDNLLEIVAHQLGLRNDHVLHGLARGERLNALEVLLQAVLGEAHPLARNLLKAAHEDG